MNRLALRGAHTLVALMVTASGACSSGSDGDSDGDGDDARSASDSGGAEVVDDALLPQDGEEQEAPDLITKDGGYRCSETQDVVIDGDGLRVGVIDECASVVVRGNGHEVDLWGAGAVTIEGTNHDIGLVSQFDSVFVNGEGQRVHLTGADSVTVNGVGNTVDVVNGSGPITLNGAEHWIQLPSPSNGVTLVTDNSADSQIEGDYTEAL